ncbi:MAG: nitroreductase family deazaflavin-dependent oxidoreductase [Chloroflexi bacterium]|nr:MAG: nitroreductase family deazaflavin-dependent oxidoreductase [Chloroflexota bacterium]
MARSRFSGFNEQLIADFRAHGGKATSGPFVGRDLLLLTTKGAKSGTKRTTPVVFTRDADRYVIVGSKGGAPTHPAWYHNLRAHPVVTIEVGDHTLTARATPAQGAERRRLYDQHAAKFPAFADYERRTMRQIPVIVLEPE